MVIATICRKLMDDDQLTDRPQERLSYSYNRGVTM